MALALLSGAAAAPAAEAELRGASLSTTAASAQLTLDLSGTTTQKIFTLDKPRRTVIDLAHTRIGRTFRMPASNGIVSDIRIGHQLGGTIRIVVQLREDVPARSAWEPSSRAANRELIVNFGDAVPSTDSTPKVVHAAHAPVDSDDRDVVVAVDAGHGGQYPGATGPG